MSRPRRSTGGNERTPDAVLSLKLFQAKARGARWRLILCLAGTATAVYLLLGVLFGLVIVRGPSMEPALRAGAPVLLLRTTRSYRVGDVVVFHTPEGEEFIKRVAAVAGDLVAVDPKTTAVQINGAPAPADAFPAPERVPEGTLFLLGDNLAVSRDSRAFGPVSVQKVIGKVICPAVSAGGA